MLISDKINQNTNLKSVKDHRENVLLAEIIKEACLLWKAGDCLQLLLHQNPLGWEKTKPNQNQSANEKKILSEM